MGQRLTRFFHPVLEAAKLKRRPVGISLGGRRIALFRDAEGRPAAVDDLCPHRHASLSEAGAVRGGAIVCGYHGWSFDRDGCGQSPAQPGLRNCDTAAFQVVERHGSLWLADRSVPESALTGLGWPGFTFAGSFSVPFAAPLHVALDNFSEDEHFPSVHKMLGWDARGLPQMEFEADNFDDRTEVRYRGPQRRHWSLPLFAVHEGDRYCNEWVTRFDPVHAVFSFRWEDPASGKRRPLGVRTAVFLVPETDALTRLHVFLFTAIEPGSLFRFLRPVVRQVAHIVGVREVEADARMCRSVHTPESLDGLRLGKFDKPVIHNRRLLRSLYYGDAAPRLAVVT